MLALANFQIAAPSRSPKPANTPKIPHSTCSLRLTRVPRTAAAMSGRGEPGDADRAARIAENEGSAEVLGNTYDEELVADVSAGDGSGDVLGCGRASPPGALGNLGAPSLIQEKRAAGSQRALACTGWRGASLRRPPSGSLSEHQLPPFKRARAHTPLHTQTPPQVGGYDEEEPGMTAPIRAALRSNDVLKGGLPHPGRRSPEPRDPAGGEGVDTGKPSTARAPGGVSGGLGAAAAGERPVAGASGAAAATGGYGGSDFETFDRPTMAEQVSKGDEGINASIGIVTGSDEINKPQEVPGEMSDLVKETLRQEMVDE